MLDQTVKRAGEEHNHPHICTRKLTSAARSKLHIKKKNGFFASLGTNPPYTCRQLLKKEKKEREIEREVNTL